MHPHALARAHQPDARDAPRGARRPAARWRPGRGPRRRSARSRAGGRRRRARPGRAAARARSAGSRRRRARRWPLARCPRSASSPSLTSHIAVAPSTASSGPSAYGGLGCRCACTSTSIGTPPPLASRCCSRARPAADQPSRPASTTRSPGCAPERRTGGRPPRSPSAVTLTTTRSLDTMSPPTTTAPTTSASSRSPSARSVAHDTGTSARCGQPDQQGGRRPAHRRDVGEVGGRGLAPDVVGARTSRAGSARPRPGRRSWRPRGRPARARRRRRHRGRPRPTATCRAARRRRRSTRTRRRPLL